MKAASPLLRTLLIIAPVLLGGCATGAALAPPLEDIELRYFDPQARQYVSGEVVADAALRADVVFFGELHGEPAAHRAQLDLLESLARRGAAVTVALEMFERDVQVELDAFLSGEISEEVFLERSRPWPNYSPDYRPLVETARANGWPVIAGNVPRSLAAAVARGGLDTLHAMDPPAHAYLAEVFDCPADAYFRRFEEQMAAHPMPGASDPAATAARVRRFYEAQCVKDETMAESIARFADPSSRIVHFNGAFHSDYRLGIVPRLERRRPGARVLVISTVRGDPGPDAADRADFLLVVP
jgi:uncharacterized iron-regulated protein